MDTRRLSGEQVATTRLIIHLAGIFGAAVDAEWPGRARNMLNHTHVKERPPAGRMDGGVVDIFLHGFEVNARTLRRLSGRSNEQLALGIHMTLGGLAVDESLHMNYER